MSSTLFAGVHLWSSTEIYCNPELSGGSGLSSALGVADALNGETYRIGSAKPSLSIARLFLRQRFALSTKLVHQDDDINQCSEDLPESYVLVTVGKVSIADFFDDNTYSHDPRSQFITWSLMDQGAWDYAANTRGYTPSVVLEYISPARELRYAVSLVPTSANASDMDWNLLQAQSQNIEWTEHFSLSDHPLCLRALAFYTQAFMGNYRESVAFDSLHADITATRRQGNTKYGAGMNAEYEVHKGIGVFARAGWNDGRNESWMFTEVDNSLSGGISFDGALWNRTHDHVGLAVANSGISADHQYYLQHGGSGFMLGDGSLHYSRETLVEGYYLLSVLEDHLQISGIGQLLSHPGYNLDRSGPVGILSLRLHVQI